MSKGHNDKDPNASSGLKIEKILNRVSTISIKCKYIYSFSVPGECDELNF